MKVKRKVPANPQQSQESTPTNEDVHPEDGHGACPQESPDNHVISTGPKVWQVKGMDLKLSALEATVAVKSNVFTYDDFEM